MKKLAIIAGLLLASSSYAATTGSLLLKGNVAAAISIDVTAQAGVNDALDLSVTATDLKVAEVAEHSNASSGYNITVQSQNSSSLKNGTIDSLAYTLKYAGSSVDLSSGTAAVAKTDNSAAVINATSDVEISYTGKPAAEMVQGEYSDTLTFTISAN